MFGYDKAEEFAAVFNGGKAMTYPDDVLKAAREAAATDEENRAEAEKAAGNLAGHSWRMARARGYRNGEYDSEEKVTAACIAIMAERERVKNG